MPEGIDSGPLSPSAGAAWSVLLSMCILQRIEVRFLYIRAPQSAAMLALSLPMKSKKKRLAPDVMYTATKHARHIHNTRDLVKMAALIAVFSRPLNADFLKTN